MAFNEVQNIGLLLESLGTQRLEDAVIEEIVVVASGCTDGTEDVVRWHAQRDSRIRLVVQERREGKASAINLFLREARGDVIVLESADTLPAPETYASLLAPFSDPAVGMTGARPRRRLPCRQRRKSCKRRPRLLQPRHRASCISGLLSG